MKDKARILYTLPSLSACDGIASYAMSYYRRLNHDGFRIDYLINVPDGEFIKEVEDNKDKVYVIKLPGFRNLAGFLKEVNDFFEKHHDYDIIHCHVPNMATFYLYYAKKYKIAIRILHSHVTRSADVLSSKIRNDLLAPIAVSMANQYAACSEAAGKFLFGKKNYEIIHNAIDLDRFEYSFEKRRKIREELSCGNQFIIGFVGRFCNQKNPLFLIDIFEEMYRIRQDLLLLMIGEGPLEIKMKETIKDKELEHAVMIKDKQIDISPFYQAMDVFVLPSRYEGLGIVYIEAQISGLPTIASTEVPKETNISPIIKYIGLKEKKVVWAEEILKAIPTNNRKSYTEEGRRSGFDIVERVGYLENYYKQLLKNYIL